jgi:hypothetical protein
MIFEWNIQSRAHACSACGKSFSDKQSYHTLLHDERGEMKRLDICDPCWQAQHSNGARERKGFISYWHGIYEAPPPPSDPIQKENAESVLRKLVELKDTKYGAASYILAVMLERKRLLKVKEELVKEGQRVFIYEQPKTGDVFTIVDPNLQLNQLEAVQREVASLLEHGLNAPAPESASEGTVALAAVPAVEASIPAEREATDGDFRPSTPQEPQTN